MRFATSAEPSWSFTRTSRASPNLKPTKIFEPWAVWFKVWKGYRLWSWVPRLNGEVVELTSVLEELRILIETTYHESEINVEWDLREPLPLVWADRYGLIQVFLNLAKNSQRAMMSSEAKRLRILAEQENGKVVIRFEDTGMGVTSPEKLFQPFQTGAKSSGLGLYVSRVIMRSFGGDLSYEPRTQGSCFAAALRLAAAKESAHA